VPDFVSISYRGATYALGQGPQFYGIWYAAAPQGQPMEQWPLTPEGWTAAWSRFASLEVPGTITQVTPAPAPGPVGPMTGPAGPVAGPGGSMTGPGGSTPGPGGYMAGPGGPMAGPGGPLAGGPYPAAGAGPWNAGADPDPVALARNSRVAAALIGVGLVLGVVGLFPVYDLGASLASQTVNLVPHVLYLVTWALSGVLIFLGGARLRAGALLGLGTSAVTLGLLIADAGTAAAAGSNGSGTGLVLAFLGWLGCTAGVVLALVAARAVRTGLGPAQGLAGRFASRPGHDIVPLVTLVLAAVGAAIAFAPAWDRFTLHTASGFSQSVTAGNAFSNPGAVIFGDLLTMIAIVAVVVVAALWRQLRLGAALAFGVAVPLVAQAISAAIQIGQPMSPQQFGISPSQAQQARLTIDAGLTPIFWVYCAFVGTLILLCLWMLVAHDPATIGPVRPGAAAPVWGQSPSGGPAAGPAPYGGPDAYGGPDPHGGSSAHGGPGQSTGAFTAGGPKADS
jgi:hypothetical protein